MLKFIINFFEPPQAIPQEREIRPFRQTIKTSDPFGQSVQAYYDKLPSSERIVAKKILCLLMRIGHVNSPPKNWLRFNICLKKHKLDHKSRRHIANWWLILQDHFAKKNCPISPANIPAAKGIIWFTIWHDKTKSIPDILQFLTNCQDTQSNYLKESKQLAHAAIDLLIRKSNFNKLEYKIHRYYPNLLHGGVGKKMKQAWAKSW